MPSRRPPPTPRTQVRYPGPHRCPVLRYHGGVLRLTDVPDFVTAVMHNAPLAYSALPRVLVALVASVALLVVPGNGSADAQTPSGIPNEEQTTYWDASAPLFAPDAATVLNYHGLGAMSDFRKRADGAYAIDPVNISIQLRLMHRSGFRSISLSTLNALRLGRLAPLTGHPLVVTFDDGLRSSVRGAGPVLRALGLRAVMFVDVGAVADGLPGHLTWPELRAMVKSGRWRLDVHAGRWHRIVRYGTAKRDIGPAYAYRLPGESLATWQRRTVGDIDWAISEMRRNIPGWRPYALSVPFGNYGQLTTNDPRIAPIFLRQMRARFHLVFAQSCGPYTRPGDPLFLGRLDITRATTLGDMLASLATGRAPAFQGILGCDESQQPGALLPLAGAAGDRPAATRMRPSSPTPTG